MPRTVTIIQGHPDPSGNHLCHALADAYAAGAAEAGHRVHRIDVAALSFPWLRTKAEFDNDPLPDVLKPCQDAIGAADHLVMVFPLWLGTMPAVLKGFLEQICRHGFAFEISETGTYWVKKLKGKTARIIITMGMPALAYRWYFGAHSLKSLERNILGFAGIGPIRESLFGGVEMVGPGTRKGWIAKVRRLGRSLL